MATNKIEMAVDLVKNTNQKSDYFGKYYGRAVRVSTLNTRGLSEHISQHLDGGRGGGHPAQAGSVCARARGPGHRREAGRSGNVLPHAGEQEGGC